MMHTVQHFVGRKSYNSQVGQASEYAADILPFHDVAKGLYRRRRFQEIQM